MDKFYWLLVFVFMVVFLLFINKGIESTTVPKCQEDEIIVGTGNFANGYWDSYECKHYGT